MQTMWKTVHMLPVSLSDRRKSCLVWTTVLNSQRGNILRLDLFIMVEYANALNNPMMNNEIFKNQNQNLHLKYILNKETDFN